MTARAVSLALLLLFGTAVLSAAAAEAPLHRRALLVGINDYSASRLGAAKKRPDARGWRKLEGAVNDVEAMREMLILFYGFAPRDIVTLTDQAATRQAILHSIDTHLERPALAGDIAFFYFSGHGSQVVNSKSTEPDRLDESLVPADARAGAADIRDKELRTKFNPIVDRGARLTVVVDSCHSGSVTRGLPTGAATRGLRRVAEDVRDGRAEEAPENRGALVIAAAQDFEAAYETVDDAGRKRGAFSWALLRAMRSAAPDERAIDTFLRAQAMLRAETPFQDPVFTGSTEARFTPFLGSPRAELTKPTTVALEQVDRSGVAVLQGGWAHGLTVGSELRPVGGGEDVRLVVTRMLGLGRSEARVESAPVRGRSRSSPPKKGTLFEMTTWAAPPGKPLRVWMPAAGKVEPILEWTELLAGAAPARKVRWIDDPTETTPSHVLRWRQEGWELADSVGTVERFSASSPVDEVLAKLPGGAALFVQLPASADLVARIGGNGKRALAVEAADGPENADYILAGRWLGGRTEYAWVRPSVTAADRSLTPLPSRSRWYSARSDILLPLRHALRQLQHVHAWQNLAAPPNVASPWLLQLRRDTGDAVVEERILTGGESYRLVLRAKGPSPPPRYLYAFVIDSEGRGVLLFPRDSDGNRFPLDSETEIALPGAFQASEPYGVDSYFLLATEERLPDPWIFEWDGVRGRPSPATPLETLLWSMGSGNRSARVVRVPANWSVERVLVQSVPPPPDPARTPVAERYGPWLTHLAAARRNAAAGRTDAAADAYQAALAALPAATDDAPSTLILAPLFGIPLPLLDPVLRTWPVLAKVPARSLSELITRVAFSQVLLDLGENERAVAELARARPLSAPTAGVLDGTLTAAVGTLYRAHWRFDEARESYRKGLESAANRPLLSLTGESEELKILLHLRDVELLGGRPAETLAWNGRALALARASNDLPRVLSLLDDRAMLLEQNNRPEEALTVLEEALALLGDLPERVAPLLTRVASLQMIRGDHATAVSTLEKAIAHYRSLQRPEDEAEAWAKLAQVYQLLGASDSYEAAREKARALGKTEDPELARAIQEADRAMQIANEAGPATAVLSSLEAGVDLADRVMRDQFWPMFALIAAIATDVEAAPAALMRDTIALMEGRTLLEGGDIAAARARWQNGLANASSGDVRTALLAAIGISYLKEKNPAEAIRWFQRAADSLETPLATMKVPEMTASYLGGDRRWYHDIAIELLLQNGRAEEAFDYSERARARAFLQVVGSRRLAPRGGAEDLLREADSLRRRIEEAERAGASAAEELARARKEFATLMVRIRTSNPEYASLANVEPLNVEALRKELPPDTALVSFYVSTYGVRAWVIDREKLHSVALPFDRTSLERTIAWGSSFGAGATGRGVTVRPEDDAGNNSAEEAFDLLIAPLADSIRHRRLIIVPHGALHSVPFAALRNARSGRYLVEDYTLMLSPSASALRFLSEKETPLGGSVLVLGNPESPLGGLEGSEREAAAVAELFGTTARTGADATEDLVHRLDGSVDLLHVAAHGTYDRAGPLFSYLALAPGAGRDGKLQVHEILSEVDLRGVNLVVLSACLTGVGAQSGGDDVVGLTRAILYAGSPGVISTLWEISDRVTALLMEEFYCRLLTGTPAAEALREAQLALLRNETHAHPRYWAAFTITGDPRARWERSGCGRE